MTATILTIRARGVFGVPGATVVRFGVGGIEAVGGDELLPTGGPSTDAPSGWLLPGLVDVHVHLGPESTRLAALHGVTTVVDQLT